MRRCSKCHVEKDDGEFYVRKPGTPQSECKLCMRARNKLWHQNNQDRVKEKERLRRLAHPGRSTEYVRRWRMRNPERNRELESARDRSDYDRMRYRNNPERKAAVLLRLRELSKRRPEIKNAITARRRARQRSALVVWADKAAMRRFYAEARRLWMETGVRHEVDHIIPLQSPVVCGLHWEGNLRVISAAENNAKGNKLLEAA